MQETTDDADEDIAMIIRVCHGWENNCTVFNFVNAEEVGLVPLDGAPEWLRDAEAIAAVAGAGPLYWAALDTDMRLVKFLDLGLSGSLGEDRLAFMMKVKRLEVRLRSCLAAQDTNTSTPTHHHALT